MIGGAGDDDSSPMTSAHRDRRLSDRADLHPQPQLRLRRRRPVRGVENICRHRQPAICAWPATRARTRSPAAPATTICLAMAGDDTYVWNAFDLATRSTTASYVAEVVNRRHLGWRLDRVAQIDGSIPTGQALTFLQGSRMRRPSPTIVTGRSSVPRTIGRNPDGPMPALADWDPGRMERRFGRGSTGRLRPGRHGVASSSTAPSMAASDVLELGEGISLVRPHLRARWRGSHRPLPGQCAQLLRIKNQYDVNSRIEWLQLNDGLAVSMAASSGVRRRRFRTAAPRRSPRRSRRCRRHDRWRRRRRCLSGAQRQRHPVRRRRRRFFEGGAGQDTSTAAPIPSARCVRRHRPLRQFGRGHYRPENAGAQAGGDAAGDILSASKM